MTAKAWVHPPWRDRLDFNLPSDIARRTDKFQLIEPGKLSVVDGIKLSFDANAAFAQVEHHWGKPGSSNDKRIRFDGSEQTPRYSAPSRPQGVERKASFQRSEYKNEMICPGNFAVPERVLASHAAASDVPHGAAGFRKPQSMMGRQQIR